MLNFIKKYLSRKFLVAVGSAIGAAYGFDGAALAGAVYVIVEGVVDIVRIIKERK